MELTVATWGCMGQDIGRFKKTTIGEKKETHCLTPEKNTRIAGSVNPCMYKIVQINTCNYVASAASTHQIIPNLAPCLSLVVCASCAQPQAWHSQRSGSMEGTSPTTDMPHFFFPSTTVENFLHFKGKLFSGASLGLHLAMAEGCGPLGKVQKESFKR